MDRGSTTAFQNEIVKSQNRPVHLCSVEFDDYHLYMTDSSKDIVYDGNTYFAVGYFLSFSDIEESANVIVSSVNISLSGVDQINIALVLRENYIDKKVTIHLAFTNAAHVLISDPVKIFDGRIDAPVINDNPDNGTSVVSVTATNAWVDFQRKAGRHSNHEEQQIHFPGDKGFEFASEIVKDIVWGKAG